MSTTTSSTCTPPKHADVESLASSDPPFSRSTPASQLSSTPIQLGPQPREPPSGLSQTPPPLPPPSSSSPPPPSPDPASELDSSLLTNIAPPEGSASVNSQAEYSTLPTDVGSISSEKSTLRPARSSSSTVQPHRHTHQPVLVIQLPEDPAQSPTVFFEVNGVRVQQESASSSPVQSPPTPLPPETNLVTTQDPRRLYPPLPSPFPPQYGIGPTNIPASQTAHSYAPLPPVFKHPVHAPTPTGTVPRQGSTEINTFATPRGLAPQHGTQETTTLKRIAAVEPRDPPHQRQPPHSTRGIDIVPLPQLDTPASSEPAKSRPKPAVPEAYLASPETTPPSDYDKPLPPRPKVPKEGFFHRWAPWLFR